MVKPDYFNYTYLADLTGWYLFYKGELIDGLSFNMSIMEKPVDIEYIEYHRLQAQQKLLIIFKSYGKRSN